MTMIHAQNNDFTYIKNMIDCEKSTNFTIKEDKNIGFNNIKYMV